jgi:aerobic C4-dicarboxylate transport protein
MKKLFTNLTFWVLVAITAGVLVGHFAPEFAKQKVLDKPFNTWFLGQEIRFGTTLSEFLSFCFINIIKQFINPIIFITITLGIVSMGNLKKVGRVGGKALLYFEIVTTFALIVGLVVALIIKPGHGLDPSLIKKEDISQYTHRTMSEILRKNSTLVVLIVAIVAGVLLNYYSKKELDCVPEKDIEISLYRIA